MPDARMRSNQAGVAAAARTGPGSAAQPPALTANALSHSVAAPRSSRLGVPVVITMWRTPSSSTAARATSASCAGVLCAIVRPAASDWPMAQNWHAVRRSA